MPERDPILPAHIEATIRSIAALHAEHHRGASALHRTVARVIALAGRPRFVALPTLLVACWIAGNLLTAGLGREPVDPAPFQLLDMMASLAALGFSVLILMTRRRDGELSQHREQLTLELAILGEQKASKIIELLEELRRDHPHLADRPDAVANEMARPADPQAVLRAIGRAHGKAEDRQAGP